MKLLSIKSQLSQTELHPSKVIQMLISTKGTFTGVSLSYHVKHLHDNNVSMQQIQLDYCRNAAVWPQHFISNISSYKTQKSVCMGQIPNM